MSVLSSRQIYLVLSDSCLMGAGNCIGVFCMYFMYCVLYVHCVQQDCLSESISSLLRSDNEADKHLEPANFNVCVHRSTDIYQPSTAKWHNYLCPDYYLNITLSYTHSKQLQCKLTGPLILAGHITQNVSDLQNHPQKYIYFVRVTIVILVPKQFQMQMQFSDHTPIQFHTETWVTLEVSGPVHASIAKAMNVRVITFFQPHPSAFYRNSGGENALLSF